jgi:hypothetical protein
MGHGAPTFLYPVVLWSKQYANELPLASLANACQFLFGFSISYLIQQNVKRTPLGISGHWLVVCVL